MGIKWKDFQLPKFLEIDESTHTPTYAKFTAEPFERGFGVTLGNSLRRVLLSSIEGSAVTNVKIDGVLHEFGSVEGVMEDVTDIIMNIKNLILRSHSRAAKTIYIKKDKAGDVTGRDIITDGTVEVLNPDLYLATLTKDVKFNVELEVGRGRGYVPSEMNKKEEHAIGMIPVDSMFSPIKKVSYRVENTRVGQKTDYDRLIIEVFTNGSIDPKEAMLYAANILRGHLDVFMNLGSLPEEMEEEESMSPEESQKYEKLRLSISELELSVRSSNCLREANIKSIADLVRKSETELLGLRNFGKKSLTEVKELIMGMGLNLGMQIDDKKLKKEK
ncbi:MAG TPA: DNA-directed RNA polymerase subunit alpha [Candidatus Omnitrophota bacterium]|nr:DNA-directed RNA polymerase subunit alpha [Candidatus Omnitrophota bacterium]